MDFRGSRHDQDSDRIVFQWTGKRVLLCAISAMFILAMVEMVLQIVSATLSLRTLYSTVHSNGNDGQLDPLLRMSNILGFVEDFLLVTNNTITDSFFIYRCYVIWATSNNKRVVVLPLFLLLVTTVVGYVTVYRNGLLGPEAYVDSRIGFALAMTTNLLLTWLSVGRIWRTRRQLQIFGQTKFIRRYNIAMAMLLESSVLYSICVCLVFVAFAFRNSSSPIQNPITHVFYGFAGQLVNIVPTLVIVQVSLRSQADSEVSVSQSKPSV